LSLFFFIIFDFVFGALVYAFFARGIVAEPPKGKPLAAKPEGDGADSPTRAG
jgi:hypothetical protein